MPAALQRLRMSALPASRLTLRWVRRTISIIDSHGLVEHSVWALAADASGRVEVSVS